MAGGSPAAKVRAMTLLEPQLDIAALSDQLTGTVVLPDDPEWDAAREAYNLTIDQRPVAVAFPAHAADVQAIVRYAAMAGLRVAPQRTGHNAAPLGPLDDTILLKTDALDTVEIYPEFHTARVGSGVKWAHVIPKASELGLAVLHGSTGDVSIAGYGLGGGVGWYGRKHGLFTNSITAIELVTADGRLRRIDHDNEPELFWAVRGGGGNFGIVTAIEFRLFPYAKVYAGILFFPWERSAEVLHAWHEWIETVPDEMTSVGRIMQFPPLEEIPEPLRGNAFVMVETFFVGGEAAGEELLAPLRALGPALDTVAMVPPVELAEMHMDPPEPLPYEGEGYALGPITPSVIDDLVAAAGPDSGSTLISVEIRHTGGAFARSAPTHGVRDTLPGDYLTFSVGLAADEAMAAKNHGDLRRVDAALSPHKVGSYLNFVEERVDPAIFYGEDAYRRLREIKAAVDPNELIRANHPIPPAR
jgi:FAD/FMN-containing dehydrogenase